MKAEIIIARHRWNKAKPKVMRILYVFGLIASGLALVCCITTFPAEMKFWSEAYFSSKNIRYIAPFAPAFQFIWALVTSSISGLYFFMKVTR